VAGIRDALPIIELGAWNKAIYDQLLGIREQLDNHYRNMQDIEFTIERGKLYMLQTRTGERTGRSAVKIAVDMYNERLIDRDEAVRRVPADDLPQLLLPSFDPEAKKKAEVLTKGVAASPGAATGKLAFTAQDAVERAEANKKAKNKEGILLVRQETSAEDIDGMHSASGIVTATGGKAAHAAVVARGWGKCCVAGAKDLVIDAKGGRVTIKGRTFTKDDVLSIDGTTGEIMAGEVERKDPEMTPEFNILMEWADSMRTLGVRTNADTGKDSKRARDYGAAGVGLCRTEHMFFDEDRINTVRQMILADSKDERKRALEELLPHQREDFVKIFDAMNGLPVTIRLLDPPLHEFLPEDAETRRDVARQTGVSEKKIRRRVTALREANPMLGHRGCRLSVTYPEILAMQVTAIVEAAIHCKLNGIDAKPEIMIPLVAADTELEMLRELTEQTINDVRRQKGYTGDLNIPIGTMIEIPRAALTAGEVAKFADFFSFGTNDLTQMTFGFSRDDTASFMGDYLENGLLECDPFESIDETGVGDLVKTAMRLGRQAKPDLKLGICGEHGGDPQSIRFFHEIGLDYVSCSPYRVPTARLAAAQATLPPAP
jgi:pyruvate,orthophosphate dikinase